MTEHPNIAKLRASRVAEYTFKTTLADHGHAGLQEMVSKREYLSDGILNSYYLAAPSGDRAGTMRATYIANLFAKHLRLSGAAVICTTMAGLMREQRVHSMEREVEEKHPVIAARGKGYIVVTDFMMFSAPPAEEIWPVRELLEAGDFLLSHVRDGGALVVPGHPKFADSVSHLGRDFVYALVTMMRNVNVQAAP